MHALTDTGTSFPVLSVVFFVSEKFLLTCLIQSLLRPAVLSGNSRHVCLSHVHRFTGQVVRLSQSLVQYCPSRR